MKYIQIAKEVINGSEVNSVNARDLHNSFDVKTRFADWVKRQLELFKEGKDFLKIEKPNENNTIEYIVTLETAKHIAMMQKNEKGMETRQYFIDIEEETRNKQLAKLSDHINKTQALFHTQEVMGEVVTSHHKAIKENSEDIKHVKEYIEEDMKTRPVSYSQQKMLLDAKNIKVYQIADKDKKVASVMHHKVWSLFKKHFEIPRYNALPTVKFNDGLEYIRNLTLGDLVA